MRATSESTEVQRFLAFAAAGGIAALVNILSRVVFSLAIPYEIAITLAYIVGMTTAFLLNKFFVFEQSGRAVSSEYLRFTLVNVVALVQVWCVSMFLARIVFPYFGFTWHAETVAHTIGVLSPIVTSYYGHKKFSFNRLEPSNANKRD